MLLMTLGMTRGRESMALSDHVSPVAKLQFGRRHPDTQAHCSVGPGNAAPRALQPRAVDRRVPGPGYSLL